MFVDPRPPRAASIDIDDPRFDTDVQRPDLHIFLDRVQQRYVMTYDMDEGFIVRVKLDDAGMIVLNEVGDEVAFERVEGEVMAVYAVTLPVPRLS